MASVTPDTWPDDGECLKARQRALGALRSEFPRVSDEHEDLVQDAAIYIATWEKPPRDYPYELTQVALRRAVDLTRKQNRRAELADPQSEALDSASASAGIGVGRKSITPEEELIRSEHCQMVRRVCGRLGEDEARALKLRFLEERSIPEVMSELGLARQSVYRRLEKACGGLAKLLPTEICPDQQSRKWAELALRHRMGLCNEAEEADYSRLRGDKEFVDVDTLSERTARGVGAVSPFVALSKASVGGPLGFVAKRLAHLFGGGGKAGGASAITAKNVAIAGAVIAVAGGGTYVAVKSGSHSPAHASKAKVARPAPLVTGPASCGPNSGGVSVIVNSGTLSCVEAIRVSENSSGPNSATGPPGWDCSQFATTQDGQPVIGADGWSCKSSKAEISMIAPDAQRIPAKSTSAPSTSSQSCTASGLGEGGVSISFTATGLACAEGEQVVSDALGGGVTGSSFEVDGFACSTSSSPLPGSPVTCAKSSEKVEFSLPG